MPEKGITIYLADDHEIVAKAIGNLLSAIDGVRGVKTFPNGKELYHACLSSWPDVIILDVEMPEWNGIQTLKKLNDVKDVPVLILTMNDEKAIVEEAIREGAKGYLHKNCTQEELQTAVNTVLTGKLFLSEEIKKTMVGLKTSSSASFQLSEPLTDKEIEVLRLVCDGLTSKEIGEKLFLSPRTVETRKNNLMQKFNVQTTGKLIAIAIKNKIV